MTARVPWVQLAVLAWCAFAARELLTAWRIAPYDRFDWLALIAWLAPVALRPWSRDARPAALWPSFVAIALAFLAGAGVLNALAYAAFAVAAAALVPPGVRWAAWVATAVTWWPAFAEVFTRVPLPAVPWVRTAVAVAGAAIVLLPRRVPPPSTATGSVPA